MVRRIASSCWDVEIRIILSALLALLLTLSGVATANAKESCSMASALCESGCWDLIALANLQCRKQCKEQFTACLKTGEFKTPGTKKTGLEKQ
jgi:hypothetical protein